MDVIFTSLEENGVDLLPLGKEHSLVLMFRLGGWFYISSVVPQLLLAARALFPLSHL